MKIIDLTDEVMELMDVLMDLHERKSELRVKEDILLSRGGCVMDVQCDIRHVSLLIKGVEEEINS